MNNEQSKAWSAALLPVLESTPDRQSPTIGALAGALAKAQGRIKPALKDSKNPFFHSTYADLASVWDAIREPLSENGLAVIQSTDRTEGGVQVITTLVHESGEWMRGWLPLNPGYTAKDGTFVPLLDSQALGSAITYGRRFALSAMVGVAPEDDDGNAAARPRPPETATVSRPSREPARAQRATSAQQEAPPTAPIEAKGAEEKAFDDDQLPGLTTWRDIVVHLKGKTVSGEKLGDLQLSQLKVIRDRWIESIDWSSTNPIYYTKQDLHLKAAVLMGIAELEKPTDTMPPEIPPTREYLFGKLRELMTAATMSESEIMSHLKKGKQCAEDARGLGSIPDDDLGLYIEQWPQLMEAWGAVPEKKKGAKK